MMKDEINFYKDHLQELEEKFQEKGLQSECPTDIDEQFDQLVNNKIDVQVPDKYFELL